MLNGETLWHYLAKFVACAMNQHKSNIMNIKKVRVEKKNKVKQCSVLTTIFCKMRCKIKTIGLISFIVVHCTHLYVSNECAKFHLK